MLCARSFADALADYQREGDDAAMPICEFTVNVAALEPPPAEVQ